MMHANSILVLSTIVWRTLNYLDIHLEDIITVVLSSDLVKGRMQKCVYVSEKSHDVHGVIMDTTAVYCSISVTRSSGKTNAIKRQYTAANNFFAGKPSPRTKGT